MASSPLPERGGSIIDRLAERLEDPRVAVLGGILHQLEISIDQGQCVVADVMKLVPEPVEMGLLRIVEHQSLEMLVLAVVERQRDDLVDRDNLGIAKGRGEKLAEVVEGGLDPLPRSAVLVDQDRSAETGPGIARCPRTINNSDCHVAGTSLASRLGSPAITSS